MARKLLIALFSLIIFQAQSNGWAKESSVSDELEAQVQLQLLSSYQEALKPLAESYSKMSANADEFGRTVDALPYSSQDRAALKKAFGSKELLPIQNEGGVLVITDGGHRVEVGAFEYMTQSLIIDGKRFHWDDKLSLRDNLKKLKAHLGAKKGITSLLNESLLGIMPAFASDDVIDQDYFEFMDSKLSRSTAALIFRINTKDSAFSALTDLQNKMSGSIQACQTHTLPHASVGMLFWNLNIDPDTNPRAHYFTAADKRILPNDKLAKHYEIKGCPGQLKALLPLGQAMPDGFCDTWKSLKTCLEANYKISTTNQSMSDKPNAANENDVGGLDPDVKEVQGQNAQ